MNTRKINCPLKNGCPLLINNSHSFSVMLDSPKDGYFEVEFSYFHDDWDNWLDVTIFYPDGESLKYMPSLPHGRRSISLPFYLKKGLNAITVKHDFGHDVLIKDIKILNESNRQSELSPNFDSLFLGEEKQLQVVLKSYNASLSKIVSKKGEIRFCERNAKLNNSYAGFRIHHKEILLNMEDVLALGEGEHKLNFLLSNGENLIYTLRIAKAKNYALQILNFNIGCASSTLITLPNGKNLLIDSSEDADCKKTILPYFNKHNIKIDYYLLTHFHSDHWGCLDEILDMNGIEKPDEAKVSELISKDNSERIDYLKNFRYLDSTMLKFYDEIHEIWDLGGVNMTATNSRFDQYGNPMKIHNIAYVKYNEHNFENSTSVSFILRYNGFGYYHGADNYAFAQTRLHEDYKKWGKEAELDCQYYYANHHFHCDISADFIKTVNPQVTFVSVNDSVYSRSTYAYDYIENVKNYYYSNKRLTDTLISFETGSAKVYINSGDDWTYESIVNKYL